MGPSSFRGIAGGTNRGGISALCALFIFSTLTLDARLGPRGFPLPSPEQKIDFDRDIAPVFRASCEKCHNAKNTQGKLRLDTQAAVLQGGVSGRVIIPGNSRDSLLVKRLLGLTDAPRMPFGAAPLPQSQ